MADRQETSELSGMAGAAQGGQTLGPYLLVERLGGGAMATVYRAVEQRTNRAVAVKVLRPDADAVMRERFRREAQTHSNLNHPNIVQILDVGQDSASGLTYIAMELVDGPDLSEVMENVARLSPADTARLLEPIAAALDYSCRQGVIHRDVKPSNVLLRRVHQDTPNAVRISVLDVPVLPLLSDFGIARALDAPELTSAGRTIGTPTYMSPEQCADSHEIDGRSDLYSLGAVFYRCVVGRPPFSGTTTQILHAHVYEPLTIPDPVLAELPPIAVHLLQHSLVKDPALRYPDGAAMAADLHRLTASGLPPAAAGAAAQNSAGEFTATMPVLGAVNTLAPIGGQTVLVPGLETPVTPVDLVAAPYIRAEPSPPSIVTPISVVTPVSVTVAPPPAAPRKRWIGAILGGVLAALVLIFGGGLALNLLPSDLVRPAPLPTGEPALTPPLADVTAAPPAMPSAAQEATPSAPTDGTLAAQTPAEAGTPVAAASPAASPGADATTTAQPLPTPAGDVRAYWAEAEAAYQDGDWENTLSFLTLARRIDPRYQGETGDRMLFESQSGLAAEAIAGGQLEEALEHLNAAVSLRPDARRVGSIQAALQALLSPGALNISMARWTLATALGSYARELLDAEEACAAADQLQAAVALSPQTSSAQLLAEAEAACARARREAGVRRELAQLGGRLLYSTQEGNAYRIYRVDAEPDAQPLLLIENGAQPARQGSNAVAAVRNTGSAQPGIALFDLAAGLEPDDRTLQLTTGSGDARDAPPSWSPDGRTLVYGSTDPASAATRLYRVAVGEAAQPLDLGPGRDPAWSPEQDRIVFNGLNVQGGEPGLWLMNSDGSNSLRLTDNGNDIRPVWTPDGASVVFMSQRDGDWEVYRLNLLTANLLQLTDNPAQDGLPAVSPDGRWVAFAGDRGGFWRIWVVPIDGGEAQPLITVNGVLVNWLEHAIQWIP